MTLDPASPVAAYCAPGLAAYAERLLDTSGETYREVIEHPWMAGFTYVVLAADPVFPPPGDLPFPPAGPPGWTRIGTTGHGTTLYTAPPGTPLPGDPP